MTEILAETKKEKWTLEDLQVNLKLNSGDYNSAISIAALYKKIYGEFPEIGLSGFQASIANDLIEKMPEPMVQK